MAQYCRSADHPCATPGDVLLEVKTDFSNTNTRASTDGLSARLGAAADDELAVVGHVARPGNDFNQEAQEIKSDQHWAL